ncbi:hypothetical protein [Mucilaginibacter sp. FT3.2]|uniref:hypothetical protein n=1 Tax=Mucilaginibacter sp. FT3.2 TaxID=2723090 RepID=UPI00161F2288|nr:hypothetical protein [Mucilaginibacter sp. FT3.2]MBB6232578.1 hypothetical protein [Mucilaginibacter sp. FT3.2]
MLLIIAHHHDAEAQWLYKTLKENYNQPLYLLMPEALGVDYSISLQLKNDGSHHASIFFYNCKVHLDCAEVSYAINRLSYIDPIIWKHADAVEKAYATNEFNAFFPAFIHSLKCPLSNRIYNGALYGDNGFVAQWALHLHQYGFAVNSLLTDTTGKLYERLRTIPAAQICRFMYLNNEIILPPDQQPITNFAHLKACVLKRDEPEMLEFIFIKKENAGPELLQVTKTPSLSCYRNVFTQIIYTQINNTYHDHTNGNTQRNALTAAC